MKLNYGKAETRYVEATNKKTEKKTPVGRSCKQELTCVNASKHTLPSSWVYHSIAKEGIRRTHLSCSEKKKKKKKKVGRSPVSRHIHVSM